MKSSCMKHACVAAACRTARARRDGRNPRLITRPVCQAASFVALRRLPNGNQTAKEHAWLQQMEGDWATARYQDVITIRGKNERTLHSQMLQPNGTWKRFMTATYRRVNKAGDMR